MSYKYVICSKSSATEIYIINIDHVKEKNLYFPVVSARNIVGNNMQN